MNAKTWEEPPPDQFRIGDVWEAPGGQAYTVFGEIRIPGRRKQVVMRTGIDDFAGKRVVRDWDAIGSFDGGRFWVQLRSGKPTPMVTLEMLERIAAGDVEGAPTAETNRDVIISNAKHSCEWMRKYHLRQAQHVGIFSAMPLPDAHDFRGTMVMVRELATVRSMHPSKGGEILSEKSRMVKAHDLLRGFAIGEKDGPQVRNPQLMWAGPGGYWCYADMNDVVVPSTWSEQHGPIRGQPEHDAAQEAEESAEPRERPRG